MSVRFVLWLLFTFVGCRLTQAQSDSTTSITTYFLEQNALPARRGSLVFNNYYILVNSVAYQITEQLKVSLGLVLASQRPPLYGTVQYSLPIGRELYLGGSIGYYQLDYGPNQSNYVIAPQLLLTKGNRQIHTTFSGGVIRGRFLVGVGSLFSPIMVNLPSRVNLLLSISHRRPFSQNLSLITQNAYVSAQAPVGSRYIQVVFLSGGLGWALDARNSLKGGLGVLFFPQSEPAGRSGVLPFLGYAYVIR